MPYPPSPSACTHSQIRVASSTAHEREERTLFVLERDVKDREARLASREKLLSERDSRVGVGELNTLGSLSME
jgi:hypothetical protein